MPRVLSPRGRRLRSQRYCRRYRKGRNIRRKAMYQSQLFTETFKVNTFAQPPTTPGVMSDGSIRI